MNLLTILSETLTVGLYLILFIVGIAALAYAAAIIVDLFDHLHRNYSDKNQSDDDDSDLGIFMQ